MSSDGCLEGYPYQPARRAGTRGKFKQDPIALLIHSGATAPWIVRWFRNPKARYWTMFAWWAKEGCLAQCDLLDQTTSHAGRFWNDFSIGIELPGPYKQCPRPQEQADQLIACADALVSVYPSIFLATTHQSTDRRKKDPGPGFRPEWLREVVSHVRVLG